MKKKPQCKSPLDPRCRAGQDHTDVRAEEPRGWDRDREQGVRQVLQRKRHGQRQEQQQSLHLQ